MRASPLLLGLIVLIPGAAAGQGDPLGPEFRINTYTGFEGAPSTASDAAGNFVVVWNSFNDGSAWGVFGQRYASSGAPLGQEFRVNTYTSLNQRYPAVAADSSGNFVVVWQSQGQDGSTYGIFGQRFASSGAPLGPEFPVNSHTTDAQSFPSVAVDPSTGTVVVAWGGYAQDGSNAGVFAQRFASAGTPLGPEFRVNSYTTNSQLFPSIASYSAGNFVVLWSSLHQDGSNWGVFGQRYAGSGVPLGPEFRVNTFTTDTQVGSFVAADSGGNFVVTWTSYTQDGSDTGVFGQRYASSGIPLGPEFRINTFTTNQQKAAHVATDAAGNFVIAWGSQTQDGSYTGVFGQRYSSAGTPLGPEFGVNTYTTGYQWVGSIAADPSTGNFVVVWTDYPQGNNGIFGQRYGRIVPVELMQFKVE